MTARAATVLVLTLKSSRIARSEIRALNTHYIETRLRDRHGNIFRFAGLLRSRHGYRRFYDIFFQRCVEAA
jgi:hypothetical protein